MSRSICLRTAVSCGLLLFALLSVPCWPLSRAADVDDSDVELTLGDGGHNEFTNSLGMKFVRVGAGKFIMGAPKGEVSAEQDEKPQHEVELTRDFFLGVHEVTQKQYQTLVGKNPSYHCKDGSNAATVQGLDTSDFPVEGVNWSEAKAFVDKLNNLAAEKRFRVIYRLPTEAEWEYACRGGHKTRQLAKKAELPFNLKEPSASLGFGDANFGSNEPYGGGKRGQNVDRTCKVGSYPANAVGIHDMHGNVWEWVADWHAIYGDKPRRDPRGPDNGSNRVLRGGSYFNGGHYLRAARRLPYGAENRTPAIGFRVACSPQR